MRFSESFAITRGPADDWFDVHLSIDTKLFVDPLLLLVDNHWHTAHDELVRHFVHCYELVAKSTGPTSVSAKSAKTLLTFPEPKEFGLGYALSSNAGAGAGGVFALRMRDGIAAAIAAGLKVPEHIEEIGILNVGIGADRISDAACNVLKARFIAYTQDVARRHGIAMEPHRVTNAGCFPDQGRWLTNVVDLPTNPLSGKPILLCPSRLLNTLPVLNANDWFDSNLNNDLRNQMNMTMGQRVRKEDIVRFARRHPDRVRKWAREQSSRPDISGYDFEDDVKGVVQWDKTPATYAATHPIDFNKPETSDELLTLIGKVLRQFQHLVEEQRGWSLLWKNRGSEKPEEAAQLLLLGLAQPYLRLFDVEIDREVELGRGPVDLKASSGARVKVLIEVKKAHNGAFWNGLAAQLPSYLTSDQCTHGWYIALRLRDNPASEARMRELPGRVLKVAKATGTALSYLAIDARPKDSASKLQTNLFDDDF